MRSSLFPDVNVWLALTHSMHAHHGIAAEWFQSMADKMDKGEGTIGKFVNDPRLYESLSDTSAELNLTVKDLHRLVQQWEQEGVSLKLGGKK